MRIALGIEYDGSPFHGWQKQPNLDTIQQHVEEAVAKVANHEIQIHCAGRTDTSVHATGQVVHFDTVAQRVERSWIMGVNQNLPRSVTVLWAKEIAEDFHARFSAISRRYIYCIYNHQLRPAIMRSKITWHYHELDEKRMQLAANDLIGEHDFSSYRSVECQSRTPMREIYALNVIRRGHLVYLDITANAFLHHMVRNIAGVLIAIGSELKPIDWAKEVLLAKDRRLGGVTAPPYGLYLVHVKYPDEFAVPAGRDLPFL